MEKHQDSEAKSKTHGPPAPEVLRPQSEGSEEEVKQTIASSAIKKNVAPRHKIYRPSHRATFIGLGVVVLILLINAGIIMFLMNMQSKNNSEVTIGGIKISPEVLDTLGVSRNTIGSAGSELVVNPNAKFNGDVTINGDVTVADKLNLNSELSANDASFTNLKAGKTSLGQLNVNGDGTITSLTLRKNLSVAGTTRLQGPVNVDQLLTINNNMNVQGNLAVGGVLSARSFQASSLTSDTTLTIGGHIITRGSAPSVSKGSALAAIDTVSISGNDAAGTVAVNIGTGSRSGIVANINFVNAYGNIPKVIVTAVGPGASNVYTNRSANGFSIGVSSIVTGGHAFDYIVMQ